MSGTPTGLSLLKRDKLKNFYLYYAHAKAKENKERISNAIRNAEKYEKIVLYNVPLHDVKAIVKACGCETKEFKLIHSLKVEAADLINILNSMPKLEKFAARFELRCSDDVEAILKTQSLKFLTINSAHPSKIFQFFNKILPENSLVEFDFACEDSISKSDEKSFGEFLSSQKFIRKLSTNHDVGLKLFANHELEELKVTVFSYKNIDREVAELLKLQPKLKSLDVSPGKLKDVIDEVCELSQLERLSIETFSCSKDEVQKLRNMKTLKELEFSLMSISNVCQIFFHKKYENLQKLTLNYDYFFSNNLTSEMLENLPNLIYLNPGNSTLKFNAFAKYLPKLEEIHLKFSSRSFEFCELDTGIVSKSLKKVHIHIQWLESLEEILEVLDICPNLEELKLTNSYREAEIASEFFEKKFFERLNEVENLKSLTLEAIEIKYFTNFYPQLSAELIKLSKKLIFINVIFPNWIDDDDEEYFSFQPLQEMLKDDFEVEHSVHKINGFRFDDYIFYEDL